MIIIKGLIARSMKYCCVACFITAAHFLPGYVSAGTSELEYSADTSDEISLLDAMQVSNQGYAEAVIIPVLQRLATSAMFLEGSSVVFAESPSLNTLNDLREQFARTAAVRMMASSFDFGPIHSLGYAAAMDTRTDIGGLDQLIAGETPDMTVLRAAARKPWLQGFAAMDYLLSSSDADADDIKEYTDSRRIYLQLLATGIRQTTQLLLDSWATGTSDYPPYSALLSTAGSPGNRSYLTEYSASEENLRGVINSLDVLTNDYLAPLAISDQLVDANELTQTLLLTRAALVGIMSAYVGRPVSLNTNINQLYGHDGAGLDLWVAVHDEKLHDSIKTQLKALITDVELNLERSSHHELSEQQAILGEISQATILLDSALQSALLQTTQPSPTAN